MSNVRRGCMKCCHVYLIYMHKILINDYFWIAKCFCQVWLKKSHPLLMLQFSCDVSGIFHYSNKIRNSISFLQMRTKENKQPDLTFTQQIISKSALPHMYLQENILALPLSFQIHSISPISLLNRRYLYIRQCLPYWFRMMSGSVASCDEPFLNGSVNVGSVRVGLLTPVMQPSMTKSSGIASSGTCLLPLSGRWQGLE